MPEQRTGGHTVSRLTVHLVWSTKYRYPVLKGDISSLQKLTYANL